MGQIGGDAAMILSAQLLHHISRSDMLIMMASYECCTGFCCSTSDRTEKKNTSHLSGMDATDATYGRDTGSSYMETAATGTTFSALFFYMNRFRVYYPN